MELAPSTRGACVSPKERATRALEARRGKNNKRANCHPTTGDPEYTDAEWEFMQAIEAFKTRSGHKFPTWKEVMRVFTALGYRKVGDQNADPQPLKADE